VEWLVATYGEVYNLRICTALGGTGAGGDHGIDHHKNWLSFPYDSTVLRLLPSLGMCGARVGVPSLGYGCGRCGGRAWRNQLRAVTTVTPPPPCATQSQHVRACRLRCDDRFSSRAMGGALRVPRPREHMWLI
jgi:hypothetical protein